MVWGLLKAQSEDSELDPLSFTAGKGRYGSRHPFNHGSACGMCALQAPYGDYRLGALIEMTHVKFTLPVKRKLFKNRDVDSFNTVSPGPGWEPV